MNEARSIPTNRPWALCAPMLLAVCAACATVSSGPYATPVDSAGRPLKGNRTAAGLMISGAEDAWYSSPNFGFIVLTFENDTDNWVRIERVNIQFGGGAKDASVAIPGGEQLRSWADAALQIRAIRNNTTIFLESLAVASSTVALWANNRSRRAGAALSTAAETGFAAGEAGNATESFPPEHLLDVPFDIPPHLFTRRWIVLQTPTSDGTPCVGAMLLDYESARAQRERVWVRLSGDSISEWQAHTCPHRTEPPQPS